MRTPRRPEVRLAVVGTLTLALVSVVAAGGGEPRRATEPVSWRGLVGDVRAPVPLGQRMIVVLKTPSVAEHLARTGFATEADERRWSSQAFASQQEVLTALATGGIGVRPEHSFTRVLNGFAAPLDPRAVALLQGNREVAGIYPVRAAFPASLSTSLLEGRDFAEGKGRRPDVVLPGFDGRGVQIALLDTGVDRSQPYLRGRVSRGIDIVAKATDGADARANPQDATQRERHGTEVAGILVGGGGPAGLHGVATAATVFPIRVAGWQPDAEGHYAVYARSDQLIAGLERAVDPNGDGDAHDAARVALVGVVEPYAAFADGPEAQAVDGALALDTLVVTPAGNDGGAGPSFGSVAGPGGAAGALTVGATDARSSTPSVRVVLRRGLQVLLDQAAPLLGPVSPAHSLSLGVGFPRATHGSAGASGVDYFDRSGFSLVAGKVALVPAGTDPAQASVSAARAGAAAVVLYGSRLPAGGLGLSDALPIPVVRVPAGPALALLAAHRVNADVGIAIGGRSDAENPEAARVTSFSSRGLAFDGRVKPNLVAPGVGIATSEPGLADDGSPAYGTVNGTSASAATVAAAAALLAQARPSLDGPALGSLLVGYARATHDGATARGTGTLDLGASAVGEVAATPTSLGFGTARGLAWTATRTIRVRNVTTRRLQLSIAALAAGESEALSFAVRPERLVLRTGREATVRVTVRLASRPHARVALGAIRIAPDGGQSLRVPWAIGFRHYSGNLLASVRLTKASFKPSDTKPNVLLVQAGRLVEDAGVQVQPVARLDVALYSADGAFVGTLARLRDLLPGSYSFGLTGRGPDSEILKPGGYELRLTAWPTLPGAPSRTRVRFKIQ